MGRLVDTDVLKDAICSLRMQTHISETAGHYRPFLDIADVLGAIDNQPTAYDTEKVIAELKELRNLVMLNNSCCKYIIDKAIEIVKRNSD